MSALKCFTISLLAGLCTTLGGGIAIKFHRNIQPTPFAGALSFAAGVMILVSFVEVYNEGSEQLLLWPIEEKYAKILALAAFLAGWALASFLDGLLSLLMPSRSPAGETAVGLTPSGIPPASPSRRATSEKSAALCGSEAEAVTLAQKTFRLWSLIYSTPFVCAMRGAHSDVSNAERDRVKQQFLNDQFGLIRIGYFTAFVLALHNVPEGIATFFTASSQDVRLSLTLALAVGIHNIPEGVAVAVPIYFSTRRPGLALWYTFLSGMAEPLGGLLAYTLLKSGSSALSPQVLGITLLMTCGIMVNVAVKELFVTALRYDVANDVTTVAFFGGMCTMAFSLMALTLIVPE